MKSRKIKSFSNLDAQQLQLWKSKYTEGVEREETSLIQLGDKYYTVVPLETENEYILVKIDSSHFKKDLHAVSVPLSDDDDNDSMDDDDDDDDDYGIMKNSKMYDSEDDQDNTLMVE